MGTIANQDVGILPGQATCRVAARSSGKQASSVAVCTVPCLVTMAKVMTDGTNIANLKLYDHASAATGDIKDEWPLAGADLFGGGVYGFPMIMQNGIYAALTGTGASFIIHYLEL